MTYFIKLMNYDTFHIKINYCSKEPSHHDKFWMHTYIPNTNRIHANIHISIAVKPSAFGEFVVILLKMLIKTRNNVMSSAIRPENNFYNKTFVFIFSIVIYSRSCYIMKPHFWMVHLYDDKNVAVDRQEKFTYLGLYPVVLGTISKIQLQKGPMANSR